jgi:alkanesulfonate monooxygenase SsuD/methylene tetrahydromethanopterin reductase-like flavin-dependent oxidoreductase (luciferase family)
MEQGRRVRFGLFLPPFGPFAEDRALVELARRAEHAGWDGIFLWDHVLPEEDGFRVADPWVLLGAMAAVTERVLLGTMVTPLARRRPWVVARQLATLNRISSGRVILGVGLGVDRDFVAFGEDPDLRRRSEKVDEALAVMQQIWTGAPFNHSGRHFSVGVPLSSPPDEVRAPIWVASVGMNEGPLRRAAKHDGIFPLSPDSRHLSLESLSRIVERLRQLGAPLGRDFDIVLRGNASPAWPEPQRQPLASLAAAGMTWWLETLIHHDPIDLSMKVVDEGPPVL